MLFVYPLNILQSRTPFRRKVIWAFFSHLEPYRIGIMPPHFILSSEAWFKLLSYFIVSVLIVLEMFFFFSSVV